MSFIQRLTSGADKRNVLDLRNQGVSNPHSVDHNAPAPWTADAPIAADPGPNAVETRDIRKAQIEETADVKTLRIFSKHYDGLATRRNEIINEIRTLEKELGETELTMKATSAALNILNDAKVSEAAAAAVEAELATENVIVHHHTGINSAS